MSVVLADAGTVAFSQGNASTFTGGLVATNGVTLSLANGSQPGAGDATMASGATLSVRGAASVGGTLTLAFGSRFVIGVADGVCGCVTAQDVLICGNVEVSVRGQLTTTAQPILVKASKFTDGDLARFAVSTADGDWPATWNGGERPNESIVGRFAAWKSAYGVTQLDAAAESAFLLGEAPAGGRAKSAATEAGSCAQLDVANVELSETAVKITAKRTLEKANGIVYVMYGDSPDRLDKAAAAIVGEGGLVTVPREVASFGFYRLCVGYRVPGE